MKTDINLQKASSLLEQVEIQFTFDNLAVFIDFIKVYPFTPSLILDFHMHAHYEFHCVVGGKGTVVMNGSSFPLSEGSFYLTGPYISHKQIPDPQDPMVEYAMQCDLKLNSIVSDANMVSEPLESRHMLEILEHQSGKVVQDQHDLKKLFEKIFDEILRKSPGYFTEIRAAILHILTAAIRNLACETDIPHAIPERPAYDYRINVIRTYIQDNGNRNITCEELARHLQLSRKQVNRIVSGETGCSVHHYITILKVEQVKQKLLHATLSLAKIAEETGFSSEYHLSNTFKKWVGLSPAEYRKTLNIKKKHEEIQSPVL